MVVVVVVDILSSTFCIPVKCSPVGIVSLVVRVATATVAPQDVAELV